MELLIAILFKLGFLYSAEEVTTRQLNGDQNVAKAEKIIEDGRYHYDADGGVVIEDDVDPAR